MALTSAKNWTNFCCSVPQLALTWIAHWVRFLFEGKIVVVSFVSNWWFFPNQLHNSWCVQLRFSSYLKNEAKGDNSFEILTKLSQIQEWLKTSKFIIISYAWWLKALISLLICLLQQKTKGDHFFEIWFSKKAQLYSQLNIKTFLSLDYIKYYLNLAYFLTYQPIHFQPSKQSELANLLKSAPNSNNTWWSKVQNQRF